LKYDEVNELERIIGNRNNEIKELNIDLKDKERQKRFVFDSIVCDIVSGAGHELYFLGILLH
jgi:hypothetical protein